MITRVSFWSMVVFASVFLAAGNARPDHWKYQDEEHWASLCKSGKHQSPIALSESMAQEKDFLPFVMKGYGQISKAVLKNNGHSAEVRPTLQNMPEVTDGGLNLVYKLDHLHFHWESEHTVDNIRFPLELHLVHYAKSAGNLSAALKKPRGVAVIAVLFELSPDDDDDFKPLIEIVRSLETVGGTRILDDFIIKDFIPRDKAGFYRYDGSLTTPGCNEGIVWTVFTNTLPISTEQVKIFKELRTEDETQLSQNYRSLQPLNGRTVYLKVSPIKRSVTSGSMASGNHISLFLLVFYIFLYKFY